MKNYNTQTYRNPAAFSGIINFYDFGGYRSLTDLADQIIQDMKFDERCKKAADNRDKYKNIQGDSKK